ncbi:FGFR1 oncogene partner 2 homolog [Stomoxys calcitrans]|uniref:FGFR1 oncogene partner 2 homolog n=1 Tax=Stomoxys calcitrans TaxID=35570 RepID=A0A1I8PQN4_STOCA|nr:FGFR1 oncogene partner 2 homolog [Stomoxys calcitrans]
MAITVGQLIMDAQRMASRVKELDALSSALLVEAEGNNRYVESLRQFQDEMDSLNRIANNKSNVEMVNRIQQQNANSSEILKENRELKVCIEDYERAMDLIMQKYREHTSSKVLESKLNFKEVYNEKLWKIIREQREKINEMAAVMQRAASIDDDCDLELITRLRLENKTLRELLQISKQFGTYSRPIRINEHLLEEKGVQTEYGADDSADELSLSGASIENANNNSVIQLDTRSTSPNLAIHGTNTENLNTDNAALLSSHPIGDVGENNNVTPAIDAVHSTTTTVVVAATASTEENKLSSTTNAVDHNNPNASAGMEANTINNASNTITKTLPSNSNTNSVAAASAT